MKATQVHVLPIVTRGPTKRQRSFYLKGVDLAVINADSLEEYKMQVPQSSSVSSRSSTCFLGSAYLRPPEIQSLAELAGQKVNFNTLGTAAAYSGH